MELSVWLSYVATIFLLIITPGPSMLLAAANSMKYGKTKTLGTIAGDLSANLIQMALASAGLATIVVQSGYLFGIIKWAGVLYLIYMGLRKILSKKEVFLEENGQDRGTLKKRYLEGFLMSAANPKAIVFFAALFPLFLDQTAALLPQILILAATYVVVDGLSLLTYTLFADGLKRHLEDRAKLHLQNKIVGVLLIISGLMLSLVKRN
ncbi:MAG: LysE family translocator [Flavobacteriaceae bacterium]|nr:LysE family translocator [Flavobacteriaceae bacterium]